MAKGKQIARLLKADISMSSDLAEIAKMLESKGRGGDTILAHITRKEAEMLKDMGGSGTINPETGLLEFYEEGSFVPDYSYGAGAVPQTQEVPVTPEFKAQGEFTPTSYSSGAGAGGEVAPAQGVAIPQFGADIMSPYSGQAVTPVTPVTPAPATVTPSPFEKTVSYPAGTTPETEQKTDQNWLQKFAQGLTSQDMVRLGLAGGGALLGAERARKAAGQAQAAQAEQQALATPYQQQGQALVGAAQRGELTPTGQQSLQAVQAQIAQGVQNRGGVGVAQAAAQVEAFRQQLLQQQYNYGLQVAQIGDSIALGAIKTGLAADQQVQQATNQFYTSLASIASGLPLAGFAQRTTT